MGYSKSLYIGPVIRLNKSIEINTPEVILHCSNEKCCQYYKQVYDKNKFCSECGSPLITEEKIKTKELNWYSFCKRLPDPDSYIDYMTTIESFNNEISSVWICNQGDYAYYTDEEEILSFNIFDKINKKLEEFKQNPKTIEIIKMLDKIAFNAYVIENKIIMYIN